MDGAALQAGRAHAGRERGRSDARLVREALDGSSRAVERLFERHWNDAYRAAYWIMHDAAAAEDVAQEAFLSVLGGLDRFDCRRAFGPWLRRAVVNRAIDHTRARTARREVGADVLSEQAAAVAVPAPDPDLLAALAALPIDQRAVVVMRHVLDCSPTEIAAALDVPRGTVNSRLRRGLDALGVALAP